MGRNPKLVLVTPKGQVQTYTGKNGTVRAKLTWNAGFGPKWTTNLQNGQTQLDLEVMKQMEAYMQMVTGAMIASMRLATDAGSGAVKVNTPYARRQYYSSSPVGRPTGPLRGPKYFQRMKADKADYLRRFTAKTTGAK